MSTSSDILYNIINRILRNSKEIVDLIDRLEIELLRPELEERLQEENILVENLNGLKKLFEKG